MNNPELEKQLVLKATQQHIPITATFELTPACNLRCKMCYAREDLSRIASAGGLKSATQWLDVARQAADAGTLFVLLTGGEPLLHPDFKQIYKGLLALGMIVSVNTNGTLLNDQWAEFFDCYRPRKINITLYGASEETYAKVCGHGAGFFQAVAGIQALQKKHIPMKLNVTLIRENASDYEALRGLAEQFGLPMKVDSYLYPFCRSGCMEELQNARLSPQEQGHYWMLEKMRQDDFAECVKQAKQMMHLPEYAREAEEPFVSECRAGSSSYWIDWRHRMLPCIFLQDASVEVESVVQAWQQCVAWMQGLELYRGCTDCPKRPLCNVCAAAIYTENLARDKENAYRLKPDYLCESAQCYIRELAAQDEAN